MKEKYIFEALDKARAGLRECLAEFEAATPHDPKVGRSFSDVQEAFEILGDLSKLKDQVSEGAGKALRERLEELLKLNALLASTVKNDRANLLELLSQSQKGLSTMSALSDDEPDAPTCDYSA